MTMITPCGVSGQDVRQHLLMVIPGLKEHGIFETTVRYLFKPVRTGTFAAERYNSVVDASVPKKENSERKNNIDAHYLLNWVKLRREHWHLADITKSEEYF